MTVGTRTVQLTMAEFVAHQWRYVGSDRRPYILSMDADSGATILAPVEIIAAGDLADVA